jgi:uncharacterized peroxidase-related enzyme
MTRLSYVERDDAEPRLHPIYDAVDAYGPFANQTRTMAHCPPVLEHVMALLFALRQEGRISRRHVELLNVTVAKLNQCDYCIAHHAPKLEIEGMSQAGIARLPDHDGHPELDETDRLIVDYAMQVNEAPDRITDRFFAQLHSHFSEAEIAELTWRIGLAGAFNRINQALDIDTESDLVQLQTASLPSDIGA